jgi:hypothetical protein
MTTSLVTAHAPLCRRRSACSSDPVIGTIEISGVSGSCLHHGRASSRSSPCAQRPASWSYRCSHGLHRSPGVLDRRTRGGDPFGHARRPRRPPARSQRGAGAHGPRARRRDPRRLGTGSRTTRRSWSCRRRVPAELPQQGRVTRTAGPLLTRALFDTQPPRRGHAGRMLGSRQRAVDRAARIRTAGELGRARRPSAGPGPCAPAPLLARL